MFSIVVNFVKPTFKNVSMLGNEAVEGVTYTFAPAGITHTQAMTTANTHTHKHAHMHT